MGSVEELLALGESIGYPLLIKAAAGGGGKGMEIVESPDQAERAFETARRQGQSYFADPNVYVEKLIVDPRHVEVQVLADAHGNVIHLGERDCTIQRRHQKLVEETPSPAVDDELRARIGAIGVEAARACGYRSAGTIEGLLTAEGEYFFMEMNTRIQVEHTVTELVTGLDLVREQILIALGEPLSLTQEQVELRGHAIECRINAEDVARGFLPTPGLVTAYHEPSGPGVRVDSGVAAGNEVSGVYDPMIAKLIVHGVDREHARRRMLRALGEFRDRRAEDADRLPSRAALARVLRARRDVPRSRRVGRARCARRRARRRARTGQRGLAGTDGRARARRRGRRTAIRGAHRGSRAAVARARATAAGAVARRRRRRRRCRCLADAGNGAVRVVAEGDVSRPAR